MGHARLQNVLEEPGFRAVPRCTGIHTLLLTDCGALGKSLAFLSHVFSAIK